MDGGHVNKAMIPSFPAVKSDKNFYSKAYCLGSFSTTVTEYHRLGNLQRTKVYLVHDSKTWKSKSTAPLSAWHLVRALCYILMWQIRHLARVSLPLLRNLLMLSWGPYPMTSTNSNYLPKSQPSNTINRWFGGLSFQHMKFRGTLSNHIHILMLKYNDKTINFFPKSHNSGKNHGFKL